MSPGLRKETFRARVLRKSSSTYRWLKKYIPPLAAVFRAGERLLLFLRKILIDIIDFKPAFYTADEINEEIKRLLPVRPDKPLFLWTHYLDAHVPYALFARKKGNFWLKVKYYVSDALLFLFGHSPSLNRFFLPLYLNLYDESLRYVDAHVKQLFEYLDSLGINADNSVFVVCADHGEAFFEHGTFGHSQISFNVNIQVPLVFYGPHRISSPAVVERPISMIDLSPTILNLAGIGQPDSYKGKDLFDGKDREVVSQASESEGDLSEQADTGAVLIFGGYKLIRWKDKRYLFSLEDEMEKNNLYGVKKEVARDLESRLKKYAPPAGFNEGADASRR
jgi:arylsulfatase A-like enzyme